MAQHGEATVIKKYANRRLYDTSSSSYVTLEDLAVMVKDGREFVVQDAKSGEDITRSVLTQIIFEQESKGQNLLPIAFLRQLIGFYGDSMQSIVPSYLEHSLGSFVQEQEKMRAKLSQAMTTTPFELVEEQVKRNSEMFQKAMGMFMPGFGDGKTEPGEAVKAEGKTSGATDERAATGEQLDGLKEQLAQMQAQIEALSKKH
ncbi:polyhydroxyalkanoate synthesis repressor PhaR [Polycladidibacter hongkongensis]|uniref:polyhydroxyalkanoate synthesis repressor PhaR n=1 Tax=Polycladidibacter hongkongensis TaxID=1647556 RepID=UPI00082AD5E3|nr:polyhydroxyalkanoate synthesis repressor PhaR [Pseudovibrio hongkongensis]